MRAILFFLIYSLVSINVKAQNHSFRLSFSTGANLSLASFGAIQNSEYQGLKQWGELGWGFTFRPEVSYVVSEKISFVSGFRLTNYSYIQCQESYLRFLSNYDPLGGSISRTVIKSNIRYFSLGIPLGIQLKPKEKLAIKTALIYYGNTNSKVESHLEIDGELASKTNIGKGEYNPIPNRNLAGELGVFYHFEKLFLGSTFEYTFGAEQVYFSNSKVQKKTICFLLGITI